MSNGDGTTFSITSIIGLVAGVALMGLGAYRLLNFGAVAKNASATVVILQYAGAVLIFFGGLVLIGMVYKGLRKIVH